MKSKWFKALVGCLFLFSGAALAAEPAPDFELPGQNGKVALSDFKGEVVYLDFWASWCPPCKASFPWMDAMQQAYGKHGLNIVAVNLDKDKEKAEQFLAEMNPVFTVAFDSEGSVAGSYEVQGMPSSYLIDRQGRIIRTHIGFKEKDRQELETAIRRALVSK